MKYVFFGSPIFAKIVLEKLTDAGMVPLALVCNPDRPAGRRQIITPPEAKYFILKSGLPIKIFQPENPSSIAAQLSEMSPDFFVVAAYAKILKADILSIPRLGTIGIHSSLLPKYRGTSPIQNAILSGDAETGVTLYLMDEKMDHGPILAKIPIPINGKDTHDTLFPRIWDTGGQKLVEIIPEFLKGNLTPQVQDESQATYTKKFATQDGFVDLEKDNPVLIERKVRALNPEPGVWTMKDGKRMKILEVELTPEGKLKLKKIQFEGKNPIEIK